MGKQNKVSKDLKVTSPLEQGSEEKKGNGSGIKMIFLALFSAVLIMAASAFGAYFFVINNNFRGMADAYGKQLENIPVLNLAVPKRVDPVDSVTLTEEEVRAKYNELMKSKKEQTKKIEELSKQSVEMKKTEEELKKTKDEYEKYKNDTKTTLDNVASQKKQISEDKKKLDQMIASGDKTGFKDYFEKVSPDIAKQVYEEVMKEQKQLDEIKKFAQLYEGMEPDAAAGVFEAMGEPQIDLIVNILKNMKKDKTSAILAAFKPAFAATVSNKLSQKYIAEKLP